MHLHLFVNVFKFQCSMISVSVGSSFKRSLLLNIPDPGTPFRDFDNSFGGAFLNPPDPSTFHTRAYSVSRGLKRMQPSNDSDAHALYSQPPPAVTVFEKEKLGQRLIVVQFKK